MNSEPIDNGLFLLVDEIKCVVDCWRTGYNHHQPHSRLECMTYAGFVALRSWTGCTRPHKQVSDEAKTCRTSSWRRDQEKTGRSIESYF
jgi:hypothetical protein